MDARACTGSNKEGGNPLKPEMEFEGGGVGPAGCQ
jgi:hypothetical protein